MNYDYCINTITRPPQVKNPGYAPAYVRTQLLLNGPGLELGSQLICMVGLEFPTKGSSLPSILITPLNSHELSFSSF